MGFWERLGFGNSAPQREWVGILGGDAVYESDTGDVRVWRFPNGDGLGVYFFNREPDLPRVHDLTSFSAQTRERVAASGAALVECTIAGIAGIPAVRQIVKVSQKTNGMTYLGSLTLPFDKFSYVLKVQCEEHGMTGVREAILLNEKLAANTVEFDAESPNAISGAWDPDSEEYDHQFPDHPLSRVRNHLRSVASSCQVNEALLKHPRFPLPQVRM